jgi:trehalose 6-phosphate synthase
MVNPYDPDETAEALHIALTLPESERRARWAQMWSAVRRNTAGSWARRFLARLEQEAAKAA